MLAETSNFGLHVRRMHARIELAAAAVAILLLFYLDYYYNSKIYIFKMITVVLVN